MPKCYAFVPRDEIDKLRKTGKRARLEDVVLAGFSRYTIVQSWESEKTIYDILSADKKLVRIDVY